MYSVFQCKDLVNCLRMLNRGLFVFSKHARILTDPDTKTVVIQERREDH